MTAGVIVAGGRSTRFGATDKAVAELVGRPLIAHVASGIESGLNQLIVSCRREQREAIAAALSGVAVPVSFAFDDREVGPLGGICDGLQASDSEWTLVVGCDFPFVDDRVVEALSPDAAVDTVDAVVFRFPDGSIQPLCGLYRTDSAHVTSQQMLAADDRRARTLVDQLSTRYVDVTEHGEFADRLENINTAAELAAAESQLSESERS